jgi:hypothetical protein
MVQLFRFYRADGLRFDSGALGNTCRTSMHADPLSLVDNRVVVAEL